MDWIGVRVGFWQKSTHKIEVLDPLEAKKLKKTQVLTVLSDTLYIQTKWHHNFLSYLLQLKLIFKAEFSARVHPLWRRFEYKKFGYRLWLLPHAQTLFIRIVWTFRACSTPPHSTEICADKRGVDLEMPTHLKRATKQQQTNQMGFDWLWPRTRLISIVSKPIKIVFVLLLQFC